MNSYVRCFFLIRKVLLKKQNKNCFCFDYNSQIITCFWVALLRHFTLTLIHFLKDGITLKLCDCILHENEDISTCSTISCVSSDRRVLQGCLKPSSLTTVKHAYVSFTANSKFPIQYLWHFPVIDKQFMLGILQLWVDVRKRFNLMCM